MEKKTCETCMHFRHWRKLWCCRQLDGGKQGSAGALHLYRFESDHI